MGNPLLEQSVNDALDVAKKYRHEILTTEHLLLALLNNPELNHFLLSCGIDVPQLCIKLERYIQQTTPCYLSGHPAIIQPTLSFQRILKHIEEQAKKQSNSKIIGINLLFAILNDHTSEAAHLLQYQYLTEKKVMNYLLSEMEEDLLSDEGEEKEEEEELKENEDYFLQENRINLKVTKQHPESALEKYCENFNKKEKAKEFFPLINRTNELFLLTQVLCQKRKNNPLLVGESGVGKTSIIEGLSQAIVNKKVAEKLSKAIVYSLDLGILLAGAKYRGEFEERFKSILDELTTINNAILFIDDIHTLLGTGSSLESTIDAASLIKPLLTSEKISCIGATTYENFRAMATQDMPLLRRFQKIDIQEPSDEETLLILQGIKSQFENYHSVRYSDNALTRAIELSTRYLTDRHLPDKAIDIIDEAGAYKNLQGNCNKNNMITTKEIEEIIAKKAGIPLQTLTTSDRELLKNLPIQLKQKVFGQDSAIDTLCNAIRLSRSGLRDKNKPIGSFLLAGPTGVGKTELTKQLAKHLGIELIRFDMSEYMERHSISRLIGAPPGYVGYEQGGLLTEEVNQHPYSILLLDEIEKAHPDLLNLLLQIMDYGQLTDSSGRKTDFHHVMIIMTTNAGADRLERHGIGFSKQNGQADSMEEINRLFSPEFRNRLDTIIQFQYLSKDTIFHVVNKLLSELRELLREKNITLDITNEARRWLAKAGYNHKMGARPMERLIKEKLKLPLSVEMVYGSLANQKEGRVNVFIKNKELQIKCIT